MNLRFVTNQLNRGSPYFVVVEIGYYPHVEMSSKCDEDEEDGNDETCGDPGSQVRVEIVEFDPTQDTDLNWQTC